MLKYHGLILKEHSDSLIELDRLNELVDKPEIDEQVMQEILIHLTQAHTDNRAINIQVFERQNLNELMIVTDQLNDFWRGYEGKGNIVTYNSIVPVYFDVSKQRVQFEQQDERILLIDFTDILEVN
ncbi:YolD-like family protein [Listeria monocytogenes]|nr:YolD-like family protein [Listeria monocytogenes]